MCSQIMPLAAAAAAGGEDAAAAGASDDRWHLDHRCLRRRCCRGDTLNRVDR